MIEVCSRNEVPVSGDRKIVQVMLELGAGKLGGGEVIG